MKKLCKPCNTQFELSREVLLAEEAPRRVFMASISIGPVTVHGLIVWRSRNGHTSVLWPQYRNPAFFNDWSDVIEVAPDLRSEIESAVIAAFHNAKKQAPKPDPDEPEPRGWFGPRGKDIA